MMRERAQAVNARLSIASEPDHGTQVALHWTQAAQQEAQ
jgi:nitrate/nitrite-specific signal transduction histidine kinase